MAEPLIAVHRKERPAEAVEIDLSIFEGLEDKGRDDGGLTSLEIAEKLGVSERVAQQLIGKGVKEFT